MLKIDCCSACGSENIAPYGSLLKRCRACTLVWYAGTVQDVKSQYGEHYFSNGEYFDYAGETLVHSLNAKRRVGMVRKYVPAGGKLHEIGCAHGFFLREAARHWGVEGSDIAQSACSHARDTLNLPVTCGQFPELPIPPRSLDVVCLWDTIEHLEDPDAYCAAIHAALKPAGYVALTTGDIASWLARIQGLCWRQIHPPTHLWYFSPQSLSALLSKHGFTVIAVRHPGIWRSVAQIVYWLLSARMWKKLSTIAPLRAAGRLPLWLNTFDYMFVVARKENIGRS